MSYPLTMPEEPDLTEALSFVIEGPDGDGFVWLISGNQHINLGPWETAAETMSEWLGSVDYLEHER